MIRNNYSATQLFITSLAVLSIILIIPDPCSSISQTPLESADCLCDLYGSVDPTVCNPESDSQRCQCKEGHTGGDCSQCLDQYYRPGPTEVCRGCQCSPQGSTGTSCNRLGACHCKSGYSGNRCDVCENGSFLTEAGDCQQCECQKLKSCLQQKADSDVQCTPCLVDVSWAKRCDVCDAGKDVTVRDNRLQCIAPRTKVTEATNGTVSKPPGATLHPGLPMTTVYALIVIAVFIILVVIFLVLIVQRKRHSQSHPANFPFWTVELRNDDVTALANRGNTDMDVMYLDDTYLMNTPENFTTTVDSVHEDDHIGYHTLK